MLLQTRSRRLLNWLAIHAPAHSREIFTFGAP
jgi:hypothetical protein